MSVWYSRSRPFLVFRDFFPLGAGVEELELDEEPHAAAAGCAECGGKPRDPCCGNMKMCCMGCWKGIGIAITGCGAGAVGRRRVLDIFNFPMPGASAHAGLDA